MNDLITLSNAIEQAGKEKRQRRKLFIEKFTPLDEIEIPPNVLKIIDFYNELFNIIWSGTNGQIKVDEIDNAVKQGLAIKNEIIKLWEER